MTTATTTLPAKTPATYVVAVSTPPRIVCPSWCVVDQAEHVADLANMDGRVIHSTHEVNVPGVAIYGVTWVTLADGTAEAGEIPRLVDCDRAEHFLTPTQARDLASVLVALANVANGGAPS